MKRLLELSDSLLLALVWVFSSFGDPVDLYMAERLV